jgi:hypothetical protein
VPEVWRVHRFKTLKYEIMISSDDMTKTIIDLCSGLGGFSEAFLNRLWKVIRIDNDIRFKDIPCTIIEDIRRDSIYNIIPQYADVIVASPPCVEFTKASLPKTWKCNINKPSNPDTTLLECIIRIIERISPMFYCIENVRGAIPFFEPLLGKPHKRVGSRYLWGRFPDFECPHVYGKWKLPPSPERPSLRSKIPYELSLALCIACERGIGARIQSGKETLPSMCETITPFENVR